MDVFATASAFPFSLRDHPIWVMFIIMALWLGTLLCLQWLYTIVNDIREDPVPWKHPLSAVRGVKTLFVLAALVCVVPRMVQVMAWERMGPSTREALAFGSWASAIFWAGLIAGAWWLDRYANPRQTYMLQMFTAREDGKVHTAQKTRGVIIFALIFVTAFATTYVRPRDVPATEQSR